MGPQALERPPWWQVVIVGRHPRRTLLRIIALVGFIILLRNYVILPIRIEGISMLPTFQPRSINFVNRLAYLMSEPKRGDIVAVRLAGEHLMFCKRVIGLPGEMVEFHAGRLFINGHEMEEPYVKLPCNWVTRPVLVAPGEYYVVGDNRSMNEGDHEKGRAARRKIVGKMLL